MLGSIYYIALNPLVGRKKILAVGTLAPTALLRVNYLL
jgi:hypothetical protein